tara:strand:- start:1649 stop:2713 length:1065 start_codon:yes stop_codon:yes gene_type:complete
MWEDPREQKRPMFFSNAGLLNQGRGGGGMPMGMSSTTTGENPLGPPPEDPMTTAMKMHYMYKGGQKGKEYIGDAWGKGKEWLGDFNPVESIQKLDFGDYPTSKTMKFQAQPILKPTPQAPSVGANIPPTGARQLFGPQASVGETPIDMGVWGDTYAAHPMDTVGLMDSAGLPGSASPDAIPWNVASEGYNASGVADFGNISADPLTSGTQSLDYAGLYPQTELSGLSNMPGSAGSAGLFTPGTGVLNASTGVFTPAGGKLLGDTVGAGSKFAGGAGSAGQAGGSAMGALGSAAGVGMNIYDMTQQGVTPGNVMGLGGSALLGANALGIGLANAWNPLGWALLAGSVAGSLFDWW